MRAWPISLDQRLPWYCMVSPLLQTNKQFVYFSLLLREQEETKTKYSAPYRFQVFHTYDFTSQMVNNWTILEICMSTIHFQLQQCEILLVRLHLMRILPILAWHIQVCNALAYTVTDHYVHSCLFYLLVQNILTVFKCVWLRSIFQYHSVKSDILVYEFAYLSMV